MAASHAKIAMGYHKNLFGVMHARAAGGVALGAKKSEIDQVLITTTGR